MRFMLTKHQIRTLALNDEKFMDRLIDTVMLNCGMNPLQKFAYQSVSKWTEKNGKVNRIQAIREIREWSIHNWEECKKLGYLAYHGSLGDGLSLMDSKQVCEWACGLLEFAE